MDKDDNFIFNILIYNLSLCYVSLQDKFASLLLVLNIKLRITE